MVKNRDVLERYCTSRAFTGVVPCCARIADIAVRSNDSEWERVVRPLTEMDP